MNTREYVINFNLYLENFMNAFYLNATLCCELMHPMQEDEKNLYSDGLCGLENNLINSLIDSYNTCIAGGL